MVTSDHLPAAPSAVLVHLLVDFFSYFLSFFIFFFSSSFLFFVYIYIYIFFFVIFSFFLQYVKTDYGGLCHFAAKNLVNMKN